MHATRIPEAMSPEDGTAARRVAYL